VQRALQQVHKHHNAERHTSPNHVPDH
jgi:hypothetical protein